MLRIYFFILTVLPLSAFAQDSSVQTSRVKYYQHQLGDKTITVEVITEEKSKAFAFVRVHDNEATADTVAREILTSEGGVYINILNDGNRLISFPLSGKSYTFDPNRMFTRLGRLTTLKLFRSYSLAAAQEVKDFATFILNLIPQQATVIALHNNSDSEFSILSYRHAPYKRAALKLSVDPAMDADDFVYTTNPALFKHLATAKINCILQSSAAPDDGSLSIHYARRKTRYVNVEAEAGHGGEQRRMLEIVLRAKKL